MAKALKALEDSNSNVRDAAITVFEEIYRHTGAPLRTWLINKKIRPAQQTAIFERFDAIGDVSGELMPLDDGPAKSLIATPAANKTPKLTARKQAATPAPLVHSAPVASTSAAWALPAAAQSLAPPLDPARLDYKGPILKVHSEKDVAKEMDRIFAITESKEKMDDWKARNDAIERIQGLVYGGATHFGNFLPLVSRLKDFLASQLLDLRSTLVTTASTTVHVLSLVLGDALEPLAEALLPSLFKVIIVATSVIADAGHQCVMNLLRQTRVDRSVATICKNCMPSSHNQLRARSIEYVHCLLTEGVTPNLDRFVDVLEDAIKTCIRDAAPGVRAMARQAFFGFQTIWPDRGNRLMETFEKSVQKMINEERGKAVVMPRSLLGDSMKTPPVPRAKPSRSESQPKFDVRASAPAAMAPPAMPASRSKFNTTAAQPLLHTYPIGTPGKARTESGRSDPAAGLVASDIAPIPMNLSGGLNTSNSSLGGSGLIGSGPLASAAAASVVPKPGSRGAPPGRMLDLQMADMDDADEDGASLPAELPADSIHRFFPPSALPQQMQQQSTHQVLANYMRDTDSMRPPQSYLTPSSVTTSMQKPKTMQKSASGTTEKAASSRPAPPTKGRSEATLIKPAAAAAAPKPAAAAAAPKPAPAAHVTPRGTPTTQRPSVSSFAEKARKSTSASALLAKVESKDWRERLECFEEIAAMCSASPQSQDFLHHFERLANACIDRLDLDAHAKVVQQILACLQLMVAQCPAAFEPFLERALPGLFKRLNDTKPMASAPAASGKVVDHTSAATSVLESIATCYDAGAVYPILLKVLDQPAVKVKVVCLEFMSHVVVIQPSKYFKLPNHMRLALNKVCPLLQTTTSSNALLLKKAATLFLKALYDIHPAEFMNQFIMLPVSVQMPVRTALVPQIPALAEVGVASARSLAPPAKPQLTASAPVSPRALPMPEQPLFKQEGHHQYQNGHRSTSSDDLIEEFDALQIEGVRDVPPHHPQRNDGLVPRNVAKSAPDSYRSGSLTPRSAPAHVAQRSTPLPSQHLFDGPPVAAVGSHTPASAASLQYAAAPALQTTNVPKHKQQRLQLDLTMQQIQEVTEEIRPLLDDKENAAQSNGPSAPMVVKKTAKDRLDDLARPPSTSAVESGSSPAAVVDLDDPNLLKPGQEAADLNQLRVQCKDSNSKVWTPTAVGRLIPKVVNCLTHETSNTREAAALLLKEMLKTLPSDVFTPHMDSLLSTLLETRLDSEDRQVCLAAEEALECAVPVLDPQRAMEILLHRIDSEQQMPEEGDFETIIASVKFSISMANQFVVRLAPSALFAQLPLVLPPIFKAFKSNNADVRKAVVFFLRDLYVLFNDDFAPFLSELNPTQAKLVQIYYRKKLQSAGGGA